MNFFDSVFAIVRECLNARISETANFSNPCRFTNAHSENASLQNTPKQQIIIDGMGNRIMNSPLGNENWMRKICDRKLATRNAHIIQGKSSRA
jgi:hypothetical protein